MSRWALVLLALIFVASEAFAGSAEDSLALFGSWRWIRTGAGFGGGGDAPPPSGWFEVFYVNRDGTCSYCQHDSTGWYTINHGSCAIHPFPDSRRASLWIELPGWGLLDQQQLITFAGKDTIRAYPGSPSTIVSDIGEKWYARDVLVVPSDVRSRLGSPRPLRIRGGRYYYVALDSLRQAILNSRGFARWRDSQYPRSIRERYPYRHDQIPSSVIGDFDGDSLQDVAMHGFVRDFANGRVVCILSQRGHPKLVELTEDHTILDPPQGNEFREPHPTLYLRLIRSGEVLPSKDGKTYRAPRDAVLVVGHGGQGIPYMFDGGEFRGGEAIVTEPWNPGVRD